MHAPAPYDARTQFWLGIRLFFPVAISIAAYGVVWGVLAVYLARLVLGG